MRSQRKVNSSKIAKKTTNPTLLKLQLMSRNRLAMFGFGITIFFVLACILAPLTGYGPNAGDLSKRLSGPTFQHLLGTDALGRDVLTRLLYGGRISIAIGVTAALLGGIIGISLGALSGYIGGFFDRVMVMVSEVFMSIPSMLLVMVLVVFIGQGVQNLIFIFAFTGWVDSFRIVRGMYFSLREESYVASCLLFGIGRGSIIYRHILPNALGPAIVAVTVNVGNYILQEAFLSFLGVGVPSGIPTWGNLIVATKNYNTLTTYLWLWIPVGVFLSLFVMGVNFLGDGLRDAFDPRK